MYLNEEDIKTAANFIIQDIPASLDNALRLLKEATDDTNAFYIEDGTRKCVNLEDVYENIQSDVSTIKSNLKNLYSTIIKLVEEVNKEIASNYNIK